MTKLDALFVEGPDDGAFINALVAKMRGLKIADSRLVRTLPDAGDAWALKAFDDYVNETKGRPDVRVGLVLDRDLPDNDKWPSVQGRLKALGLSAPAPASEGAVVDGRYGIWMWPDNVTHGTLETFVAAVLSPSPTYEFAHDVSRTARESHGAEFRERDLPKAALKVRSVWRDATAAGGYGHLVRNLEVLPDPAAAFLAWFDTLFLR
ncbi:MAG: hypothetical protein KIT84_06760 [Labilithrix sp.]|nr:hypothetical protein [Labilithrix sp.]MCW5810694.1 hypothetical protein [Labilithrix sp.]